MIGRLASARSTSSADGSSTTASTMRWPATFHRCVTAPACLAPSAASASRFQIPTRSLLDTFAGCSMSKRTKNCTAAPLDGGRAPAAFHRSGVVQVLGLVVVDGALARGAAPARLHRRPARGVAGGLGVLVVARAPVGERAQRAGQLAPRRAELVDEARWALRVRLRDDEPLRLEVAQPLGED